MNRVPKFAALVATSLAWAPHALWAQTQPPPTRYSWGPDMMGWGGGWFAMILGPLLMAITLAALIAVAILLARWITGPGHSAGPPHPTPPARTPLDILKERYARGEIDKEEFEERRRVLGD